MKVWEMLKTGCSYKESLETCELFSGVMYHKAKPSGACDRVWPPNPGSNAGNLKWMVLQVARNVGDCAAEASSRGIL